MIVSKERVMIFISILILIVAIALPSFHRFLSSKLFIRISTIIFLYAGTLSLNVFYIQSIGSGIGIYSGLFNVTMISQCLEIFLFIVASMILISWPLKKVTFISSSNWNPKFEQNEEIKMNYQTEYSLIVLFSTLGASLFISSSDLISMYLTLELQSFGVYILATLYRDSESATSAGLKYFLLGGLSSCLILFGIGLIYTFTGLTQFESIYHLISVFDHHHLIQSISLGFIFIFVGLLFKIAAAPLHYWAPDVYDDSPTIVTIWLTIMPKISIIVLLLEIQTQLGIVDFLTSFSLISNLDLFHQLSGNWNHQNWEGIHLIIGENGIFVLKNLFLVSSLLSLLIGTIVGLAQTRIKRLLAYSTISHIGFILLALSLNTEQSIDSLIFYLIQYSITNLNTFLILIALGYTLQNSNLFNEWKDTNLKNRNQIYYSGNIKNQHHSMEETENDIKFISELKGQFYFNPLLSLSLTFCLFSMAGIPPFIGFFSKQFVLYSAIQNGYYFMSILAIIVSVISASYYLKIIKVLHTDINENTEDVMDDWSIQKRWNMIQNSIVHPHSQNISSLTNFHSFLISSLTLIILLFVIKPSIILNMTQLLSLSLYPL
jgi:NADH-ubiquinone oxidoreductase chain 2